MNRLLKATVSAFAALTLMSSLFVAQADPISSPAPGASADATPAIKIKLQDYLSNGKLDGSKLKTHAAILVDSYTGNVLYGKNADDRCYPASTTKILTALIVLERGKLSDTVTIGNLGSFEHNSTMIGLLPGETISVKDLLYGMMLKSGNDASVALAQYIGETKAGFADIMNEKAQELGMTGSHFVTSNGLNDPEHYTTAADMAKLARAAMQNPEFRAVVSTRSYTAQPNNKQANSRTWKNGNRLIYDPANEPFAYPYALGLKTGYTTAAGQALVSSARKGDTELIAVVLKGPNKDAKWTDSMALFEYGFSQYETVNIPQLLRGRTRSVEIPIDDGSPVVTDASIVSPEGLTFYTAKTSVIDAITGFSNLQETVELDTGLHLPIQAGQALGTITYSLNGEALFAASLFSTTTILPQGTDVPDDPTADPPPSDSPSGVPATTTPPARKSSGVWKTLLIILGILLLAGAIYWVVGYFTAHKPRRPSSSKRPIRAAARRTTRSSGTRTYQPQRASTRRYPSQRRR